MAANKRTKIQIKNDRVRIAELYIKGVYQSVIAAELGLDQSQISRDLKAIQAEWIKNTTLDLDHFKGKEIAKIDQVERTAWEGYTRSLEKFKSTITTGRDITEDKETGKVTASNKDQVVKVEERNGDPRFLDVVMKCIERRCKLLGLDEAQKHEHSGSQKSPLQIYLTMSEHERKAKLTQLLSRVQDGIQESDCNEQGK